MTRHRRLRLGSLYTLGLGGPVLSLTRDPHRDTYNQRELISLSVCFYDLFRHIGAAKGIASNFVAVLALLVVGGANVFVVVLFGYHYVMTTREAIRRARYHKEKVRVKTSHKRRHLAAMEHLMVGKADHKPSSAGSAGLLTAAEKSWS